MLFCQNRSRLLAQANNIISYIGAGAHRREETVKATIRAKKIAETKAARCKPTARGTRRGAAKAAVTESDLDAGRDSPVLPPSKGAGEVSLSLSPRSSAGPLSASGTHNTPGKSAGHKESESISAWPRLAIQLPAAKAVEQMYEAAGANAKETPSAAVAEDAKEAGGKAPRRSTRTAGKGSEDNEARRRTFEMKGNARMLAVGLFHAKSECETKRRNTCCRLIRQEYRSTGVASGTMSLIDKDAAVDETSMHRQLPRSSKIGLAGVGEGIVIDCVGTATSVSRRLASINTAIPHLHGEFCATALEDSDLL